MREEVLKKYKLVGIEAGIHNFPVFGTVDLTTITLAEADAMVKLGFKFLQPAEKAPKPEAPAK